MLPVTRDRLVVGIAAALAVAVPVVLLWPAAPDIHDQPAVVATALPPAVLTLTGDEDRAPLFSPQRSPEDENAAASTAGAAAAPPAPAPPPVLVGIALGRGGGVALVKPASGDTVRVGVGEEVDGWRIVAIAADHVTLDQGEHRMALGFDFGNKPPAAGAGVAAGGIAAPGASPPPDREQPR